MILHGGTSQGLGEKRRLKASELQSVSSTAEGFDMLLVRKSQLQGEEEQALPSLGPFLVLFRGRLSSQSPESPQKQVEMELFHHKHLTKQRDSTGRG